MLGADLLKILCCPENHEPLAVADAPLIDRLNQQIAAGPLRNRAGQPGTEKLDGGLIRADRRFLYPVRQDIPVLLIDEAIPIRA